MDTLIVIMVIGVVVGAIVWNKRNANVAATGVEFHVPAELSAVSAAIHTTYNVGTFAKLTGFAAGIRVTGGDGSFRFESRIGDTGHIELTPSRDGTRVRAATDSLYVGAHPRTISQRSSFWALASRLGHASYVLLGIAPNAAKMKRFQRSIERKVTRKLARVSH